MEQIDSENTSPPEKHTDDVRIVVGEPERIYPIIGIEFKGNRRHLFNNPMEFPFRMGDYAVVRVEKGEDLGRIVHLIESLPEDRAKPEFEVLRKATAKDLKTLEEYRTREEAAKETCKEKIAKHGLEMKLVDVEYQFDGRKLTFYFTADGRIDFRQLVKDLAATFRTRIELKQIGARDETRRFGGLGPCGLRLCCASFILDFCPITTQMAKDQNLPLNPSKISGCCGRLKCCLHHELAVYREALEDLPRWDSKVRTQKGIAVVEKLDVFNRRIVLRYPSGDLEIIEAQALQNLLKQGFELQEDAVQKSTEETETEVISDDETECNEVNGTVSAKTTQWQRKSARSKQTSTHNKSKNIHSYPNKQSRRVNSKRKPYRNQQKTKKNYGLKK